MIQLGFVQYYNLQYLYVSCQGVFLRNPTFKYANDVKFGVNLTKKCFNSFLRADNDEKFKRKREKSCSFILTFSY